MLRRAFSGSGRGITTSFIFGALVGGLKSAVFYFEGYESENTVTVSASMIL